MTVFTKHLVSDPPAPPVRETAGHLMLRAWCVFVLFTAIAASAWNELLGVAGFSLLIAAIVVLTTVIWVIGIRTHRAVVVWRKLPWLPLAYVALAGVSILWSAWPGATALTWFALVATTLQGFFVASALTWHELVRAVGSALKWVLGLSLLMELYVALVLGKPLLPNFVPIPKDIPRELYWVRGNLFGTGRIQGIIGNSNLLAMAALLGIVVFSLLLAARIGRRGWLIAWIVVAGFLLVRSGSATVYLAGAAAALVLATALAMRTAKTPGARTKWYLIFGGAAVVLGIALWFGREYVFAFFGRSGDATGRGRIWTAVWEKAIERPIAGWGYSSPWLPWEHAIQEWNLTDHHLTVFMAHNMWLDVFLQLGVIGVVVLVLAYLVFIWRAWFFAVDRPRWDLRADRPYSSLTLLPTLVATLLLVQGIAESRPLMEWGWMFFVMLSFKIKQAPLIGQGPAEVGAAIERGEAVPAGAAEVDESATPTELEPS